MEATKNWKLSTHITSVQVLTWSLYPILDQCTPSNLTSPLTGRHNKILSEGASVLVQSKALLPLITLSCEFFQETAVSAGDGKYELLYLLVHGGSMYSLLEKGLPTATLHEDERVHWDRG